MMYTYNEVPLERGEGMSAWGIQGGIRGGGNTWLGYWKRNWLVEMMKEEVLSQTEKKEGNMGEGKYNWKLLIFDQSRGWGERGHNLGYEDWPCLEKCMAYATLCFVPISKAITDQSQHLESWRSCGCGLQIPLETPLQAVTTNQMRQSAFIYERKNTFHFWTTTQKAWKL